MTRRKPITKRNEHCFLRYGLREELVTVVLLVFVPDDVCYPHGNLI